MRIWLNGFLSSTVIAFFAFACGSSNFKSGSQSQAPSPNPSPKAADVVQSTPIPQSPAPIPSPQNNCPENSQITQVVLLVNQIKNKALNQFLEYELTLTDCNGDPKPLNGQQILFDIDASSDNFGQNTFRYEIIPIGNAANTSMIQGQLQNVLGSDLFGNKDNAITGERFAHWRTDNVSFDANTIKVKLRIDVSNNTFTPRGQIPGNVGTSSVISTHLTFGSAKPVQQQVTFTN